MNTLDQLLDLAARRFSVPREGLAGDGDVFASLGIDSMQVMSLLTEVENVFEVEIPDYELRDVRTFAQLSECVEMRL